MDSGLHSHVLGDSNTEIDDTSLLHVQNPLRAPIDAGLRRGIQALLTRGERRIVLDLSDVSDLDAAGLGELVRAYNMTTAANGVLQIANPTRHGHELLARVGLFDLLNMDSEFEDAIPARSDREVGAGAQR